MTLSREALAAYLESVRTQNQLHRRPQDSPVPFSFGQEQIWLHSLLAPDLPLFNETVTIRYKAKLSADALEQSLNEIIRRHEAFRTSVRLEDGIPYQEASTWEPIPFQYVDLRSLAMDQREPTAIRLATESARELFDFAKAPLMRALVVSLADNDHRLFLTLHHLIFDGVTIRNVLLPELTALYLSFSRGQPSSLPPPELQYGDYAYWQRNQPSSAIDSAASYWKSQLAGLPALNLPIARPRAPATGFHGGVLRFEFGQQLTAELKECSRREHATLYNLLLANLLILLSRYSGQVDIPIGTVSAGRSHPEFESIPGYFLNTIVLRTDLSGSPAFRELLGRVQQVTVSALSHAEVPFQDVVRELHPTRDNRNPLVQVLFSVEPPNGQVDALWELVEFEVENGRARIDLQIELDETHGQLAGRILYSSDLFDRSTIEHVVDDWKVLLQAIVSTPEAPLWDLPLSVEAPNQAGGENQNGNHRSTAGKVSRRDSKAEDYRGATTDEPFKATEAALATMWCELLHLERVGRQDNFFDLGGHSLLGARLLSRVAQKFSQRLSFTSLIQAPTIAEFAPLLHGGSTSHTTVYKASASAKKKLLWIGTNAWLHSLAAHLDPNHSLYSLTLDQAELESLAPNYKMEELARTMMEQILDLQPEGPYFLGGFCLSTLLAYECAQQLRRRGYDVALLILGDALSPGAELQYSWIDWTREKMGRVIFHASTMSDLSLKQWRSYMQERIELFKTYRAAQKWQKPDRLKNPATQVAQHLLHALCAARKAYLATPYQGKVLFLESGGQKGRSTSRVSKTWEGLVPDGEIYLGPPGNTRLFDARYMTLSAEKIQSAMSEAVAQSGMAATLSIG